MLAKRLVTARLTEAAILNQAPAVHRSSPALGVPQSGIFLHFVDPSLEEAFRREYERVHVLRAARTVYAVALVILSGYVLIDRIIVPDAGQWPWLVRFGFMIPMFLGLMLLTTLRTYGRIHDVCAIAGVLTVMGGIAWIGTKAASPGREMYMTSASAILLFMPGARVSTRTTAVGVGLGIALLAAIGTVVSLPWATQLFVVLNTSGIGVGALMGSRLVEDGARLSFLQQRTIEAEQQRSERLLLNVLPASIAARLKEGGTIADHIEEVTVLFADVVGFTPMAARLSPDELVARLGELFAEFDRLANSFGIEKIKTIGDAYMAVAGAPAPSKSGPDEMADMALLMLERVQSVSARFGEVLSIRAGIHTGPAVAGVLGTHKFSYDLWGQTVNLAARMENHGVAGRVQITDATRLRLGDRFTFEDRGEINVKGLGMVRTWFLLGRTKLASQPVSVTPA